MGPASFGDGTTQRVLGLLGAMAERPSWSVKELAAACRTPESSTYRLLGELVAAGWAHKIAPGRYGAGPLSVKLAAQFRGSPLVAGPLTSLLAQHSEDTGEMAAYMVISGSEALCVAAVESRNTLRCSFSVGAAQPLVRGATALALLSTLDDLERDRVLSEQGVGGLSAEAIAERCRAVRETGFATSLGALDPGVWGVSVPVAQPLDGRHGALTLMAPRERVHRREAELIRSTMRLAAHLGDGVA